MPKDPSGLTRFSIKLPDFIQDSTADFALENDTSSPKEKPAAVEQEYTDYSCSTSIERLARDVETVLRSWHVDQGSDRHVSLSSSTDDNSNSNSNKLIRNQMIAWTVTVTTLEGTRVHCRKELELNLWDDSSSPTLSSSNTNSKLNSQADDDETEDWTNLPKSLHPRHHKTNTSKFSSSHFDNFSDLFGIGQHITLTPVNSSYLDPDLQEALFSSLLLRHEPNQARMVFTSMLSGWLQSSLNLAAANCQCALPVFGLWGNYNASSTSTSREQEDQQYPLVPAWAKSMPMTNSKSKLSSSASTMSKGFQKRALSNFWNQRYTPSIVNGSLCLSTTDMEELDLQASFSLAILPNVNNTQSNHSNLLQWAKVLQHALPDSSSAGGGIVQLTGARHVFGWYKKQNSSSTSNKWRTIQGFDDSDEGDDDDLVVNDELPEDFLLQKQQEQQNKDQNQDEQEEYQVQAYRSECRDLCFSLWTDILLQDEQQQEQQPQDSQELWGPDQDPISSVFACTTWSGNSSSDIQVKANVNSTSDNTETEFSSANQVAISEPILQFPLQILKDGTNNHSSSNGDATSIQASLEDHLLNPLQQHDAAFTVQVYYDRQVPTTPLAARQRCLLAALIRTATLPPETLVTHLTDLSLMSLWDNDAGTLVAVKVAEQAGVSSIVTKLTQVLDWKQCILQHTLEDPQDAQHLLDSVVLDASIAHLFPVAPPNSTDGCFLSSNKSDSVDALFLPFPKAAPYGRLVSILCTTLAQQPTLSSMAVLWEGFCQELRRRWECRESLPNMVYVAGLDPHPLELYQERSKIMNIAQKANFSAVLNCSEPDPDDYHVLLGQKLQVLNLSVESIVATERAEQEAMERFLGAGHVPLSSGLYQDDQEDSEEKKVDSSFDTAALFPEENENDFIKKSSKPHANNGNQEDSTSSGTDDTADETEPNFGPPAIDTDMEFWVMDDELAGTNALSSGANPSNGNTHDGSHSDYRFANPLVDDTGHGLDYIPPPTTTLDDNVMELMGLVDGEEDASEHNNDVSLSNLNQFPKTSTTSSGAPQIQASATSKIVIQDMPPTASTTTTANGWEGTILQQDDEDHDSTAARTNASLSQAYFDAAEAGSIFSLSNGFVGLETHLSTSDMVRRPGARCPVHGVTYNTPNSRGEQVFAPYLQRPVPLTDDVVLERRTMVAPHDSDLGKQGSLQNRLQIAQRLQRPKLLSDMRSFQAANPGCGFEDFTRWYGNPGNPLDDYSTMQEEQEQYNVKAAIRSSAAKKLDKASQAMQVLVATRDFWTTTWEQAQPIPAHEQKPLFDIASTAEMALDYLEQLHPSNLLNQVVAVNLSQAYFTLAASAQQALTVGMVQQTLERLRSKIELALKLLSEDACGFIRNDTGGDSGASVSESGSASKSSSQLSDSASSSSSRPRKHVTDEAIYACDQACTELAQAETLIARAVSLLGKFPNAPDLVHALLLNRDGTPVELNDPKGRRQLLETIRRQQQTHEPQPVLREYVLKNIDTSNPCQLSVRFGKEVHNQINGDNREETSDGDQISGGIIVAISKCRRD